ncbi:MAG TPA: DUF427 domain-containing protein [Pseudonocardia sp.]|jgi:uncharacterized protein (DUF427 family)|nr:DUF427 domain-containing protein [Pseudonocardia sp.]
MDSRMKSPGPEHPISVEPTDHRVVVRLGRRVVADTTAALTLHEASYPPVYYVPRTDIDETQLTASSTHTYCPYKGEADYHGLTGPDGEITDAVWTYPTPYDAVAEIAGYLAFYPDKVRIDTDGA